MHRAFIGTHTDNANAPCDDTVSPQERLLSMQTIIICNDAATVALLRLPMRKSFPHRKHTLQRVRVVRCVRMKKGTICPLFWFWAVLEIPRTPAVPRKEVNLTSFSGRAQQHTLQAVSLLVTKRFRHLKHIPTLADYSGSVCCADAYALSCPLRSLRLCCSRVLAPRSQSNRVETP